MAETVLATLLNYLERCPDITRIERSFRNTLMTLAIMESLPENTQPIVLPAVDSIQWDKSQETFKAKVRNIDPTTFATITTTLKINAMEGIKKVFHTQAPGRFQFRHSTSIEKMLNFNVALEGSTSTLEQQRAALELLEYILCRCSYRFGSNESILLYAATMRDRFMVKGMLHRNSIFSPGEPILLSCRLARALQLIASSHKRLICTDFTQKRGLFGGNTLAIKIRREDLATPGVYVGASEAVRKCVGNIIMIHCSSAAVYRRTVGAINVKWTESGDVAEAWEAGTSLSPVEAPKLTGCSYQAVLRRTCVGNSEFHRLIACALEKNPKRNCMHAPFACYPCFARTSNESSLHPGE